MTASNANNVILSKDGKTVTISTTEDEENITKSVMLITPPKSTSAMESDPDSAGYGPNDTKVVDILNKVEQRITIDGFLATGMRTVGAGDSSLDAESKKTDLKKMVLGGGVVAMTYEGSTFNVSIDKISIKNLKKDGTQATDGVVQFSVKFTAVKGEDIA